MVWLLNVGSPISYQFVCFSTVDAFVCFCRVSGRLHLITWLKSSICLFFWNDFVASKPHVQVLTLSFGWSDLTRTISFFQGRFPVPSACYFGTFRLVQRCQDHSPVQSSLSHLKYPRRTFAGSGFPTQTLIFFGLVRNPNFAVVFGSTNQTAASVSAIGCVQAVHGNFSSIVVQKCRRMTVKFSQPYFRIERCCTSFEFELAPPVTSFS